MRIVGIPGDQVEVRQGEVWIDGKLLNERYRAANHAEQLASCPATKLTRGRFYVLLDDRTIHTPEQCGNHTISRQQIVAKVVGKFYSADGFDLRNF